MKKGKGGNFTILDVNRERPVSEKEKERKRWK